MQDTQSRRGPQSKSPGPTKKWCLTLKREANQITCCSLPYTTAKCLIDVPTPCCSKMISESIIFRISAVTRSVQIAKKLVFRDPAVVILASHVWVLTPLLSLLTLSSRVSLLLIVLPLSSLTPLFSMSALHVPCLSLRTHQRRPRTTHSHTKRTHAHKTKTKASQQTYTQRHTHTRVRTCKHENQQKTRNRLTKKRSRLPQPSPSKCGQTHFPLN